MKKLCRLDFGKIAAQHSLLAILALFAAAKLVFLLRYHLPIWDEAVYLGMGKYIYSFGNAGLWEILRPPGLPALIGIAWKAGLPYTLFSEVIALLFGMGSIALTYLIAKGIFSKKAAVLAAALLAASPLFFLYSSYILAEIPSAFFALAAICLFTRHHYFFSGAAASLSMLFKFPNGLLLFAIGAAIVFSAMRDSSRFKMHLLNVVKVSSSFIAVTLPFLIFNYVFYRPFTSNPFDAIFRPFILGAWHQSNPAKAIAGALPNYAFYLVEALRQHVAFVFMAAAIFLFLKKKWHKDHGRLPLGIFLAVYFAYFTYILNKDERFILLFLPAICIFSAAAFFEMLAYFNRKRLGKFLTVAAVLLVAASFAAAAFRDYGFYSWRPASEPVVVKELYRSITRLGIAGPVLTSEPVFAAYSENLFFPYYFTQYDGIPAELRPLNEWEQNTSFEAIIYSPGTLYCPEADLECKSARANLYPYLKSVFNEAFSGTYYKSAVGYTVFVNESYRT